MSKLSRQLRSQGADLVGSEVRYRTWAPGKEKVDVVIFDAAGHLIRIVSLGEETGGYFTAIDPDGRAGDRYQYRFGGNTRPDPASRFNPAGVHGTAQVIDPNDFEWRDAEWSTPPVSGWTIYELHIGTFTPEGTFRAAIGKLDAAHQHGLAVILDVVYNHLGPDGNYLGAYSRDYFNPEHKTPWGDRLNFELKRVRDFFAENTSYWRREFHIDGFRLDATHAIVDTSDKHVLAEIAELVHSLGGIVTAEDERNDVHLLLDQKDEGIGLDAIWADDFHHVVRVMLTGMREGYYCAYEGTVAELAATLEHGWLFEGSARVRQHHGQAAKAGELPRASFIFCITNR